MGKGSVARNVVPETLFDLDDPPTHVRPKVPEQSAAMARLVAEQEAKLARRKSRKTVGASVFNRARTEAEEMKRSRDWSGATARHLVALYDLMHEQVYGVEALELGPAERHKAMLLAGNFVKHHFGGDVEACVAFLRWVWTREMDREKWRRENGRSGQRIGIRLMLSTSLLTDYRVDLARRGNRD
jgi:hypothetical protein